LKAVVKAVVVKASGAEGGWRERFWSKVNKRGPVIRPQLGACWIWTAATDNDGYGLFDTPVGKRGAHRVSLEEKLGRALGPDEIPLHKCDNPICVNPDHLEPGTHADNMRDMKEKRRARGGRRTKDGLEPINRRTLQGEEQQDRGE
jgi:hypothetical protein